MYPPRRLDDVAVDIEQESRVELAVVGKAVGLFAVTNIDDLVVLTLFLSQATGRASALRVVTGQYLGFATILLVAVAGAAGARLLPASKVAYLGLIPFALGLRAGWRVRSEARSARSTPTDPPRPSGAPPGVLVVAAVTFANGGDNIGVYLPVFTTTDTAGVVTYCAVFLILVGAWCGLGRYLATRGPVANALARWNHMVLPVVLVAIGLLILIEGGALGL